MIDNDRTGADLRVAVVGRLRGRPGGVISSLKNLRDACALRADIEISFTPWYMMWRFLFNRPDVAHFHFSNPIKRAFGTLLARMLAIRAVHTVHGNKFDINKIGNRIACRFSHGFILLNRDIFHRFTDLGIRNVAIMTPILGQSYVPKKILPVEPELEKIMKSFRYKKALVYSNNVSSDFGRDIYGFEFISKLVRELKHMGWGVIFLDPNAVYSRRELLGEDDENAILWQEPVSFEALLREVDIYVRPTTTDGSSVAVLEAMQMGVPVIASDVVPRPEGVLTYRGGDSGDFLDAVKGLSRAPVGKKPDLTPPDNYVAFMRSCAC